MSQEMRCANKVAAALIAAARERGSDLAWIESEREVVAVAANEWAMAHGYAPRVTVAEVERLESMAIGHIDYAQKLALYVAEFVCVPEGESYE